MATLSYDNVDGYNVSAYAFSHLQLQYFTSGNYHCLRAEKSHNCIKKKSASRLQC